MKTIKLIISTLIILSLMGCSKKVDYTESADKILSMSDINKDINSLKELATEYLEAKTLEIYNNELDRLNEINIDDIYNKNYNEFLDNKHNAETVGAIDSNGKILEYSEDDLNIFTRDIEELKRNIPDTREDIIKYMDEIPLISVNEDTESIWLEGVTSLDGNDILIGMSNEKFNSATSEVLKEYALEYLDIDNTYSEVMSQYKDTYTREFERMQKRREESLVEEFENPITSDFITVNTDGEHVINLDKADVKDGKIKYTVFNREEEIEVNNSRVGHKSYTIENLEDKKEKGFKLKFDDGSLVKVNIVSDGKLSLNEEDIKTLLK